MLTPSQIIAEENDLSEIETPVYVPALDDIDPDKIFDDLAWDSEAPEEPWRGLSDIDGLSVEWDDSYYGRYWTKYDSEEEMHQALESNNNEWNEYRQKMAEYKKTHEPYIWLKKYIQ